MNLNFELKLNTRQVMNILINLALYILIDQIFDSRTMNLGVLLGLTIGSVFFLTKGDSKAASTSFVVLGHLFGLALAASLAATTPTGNIAFGAIIFNITTGSFLACLTSWLISIGDSENIKKEVEEKK